MSGTNNGTGATPQDLHLVYPTNGEPGEGTRVRYTLAGDNLVVNFEVTTRDLTPVEEDDGEIYNGNVVEIFVCTILGPTGGRRFYSAYLPPQPKPNFHLPSFFKPLPIVGSAENPAA